MSKSQKLKQVIKEEADVDENQLIVGANSTASTTRSSPVDINEYVKLRRVDTKRENCKKIE